jgi:pimeloyl-ACP methyl ester carboxylesterase
VTPPTPLQLGDGIAARILPGPGEKIIWIHGYTIDSSLWDGIWRMLPEWYHIGIDLPGHGYSAPWPPNPTLPGVARTIGALAVANGVRHVVGLSFGTAIALQLIIEFPNEFASLTLGAPAIGGGSLQPSVGVRYRELMALYRSRGPGPWMTEAWMRAPSDIFDSAVTHPQLWQQLAGVIDRHNWLELKTGAMRDLPFHPQTAEMLQQITVPILILIGEQEMPPFKQAATTICQHVPNCTRIDLPDTGHLCFLEQPDVSSRLIGQHLAKYANKS